MSSGKDCVSYDENLEPVATENETTKYAAQVAHEEQQEAEFQRYGGPQLSRQKYKLNQERILKKKKTHNNEHNQSSRSGMLGPCEIMFTAYYSILLK